MLPILIGRLKCLATGLNASLLSFSTSRRCSRDRSPSRLPVSPMYNILQKSASYAVDDVALYRYSRNDQ